MAADVLDTLDVLSPHRPFAFVAPGPVTGVLDILDVLNPHRPFLWNVASAVSPSRVTLIAVDSSRVTLIAVDSSRVTLSAGGD